MMNHPDILGRMAADHARSLELDAERSRLTREARRDHASKLARLREKLRLVPPRERRTYRPARV